MRSRTPDPRPAGGQSHAYSGRLTALICICGALSAVLGNSTGCAPFRQPTLAPTLALPTGTAKPPSATPLPTATLPRPTDTAEPEPPTPTSTMTPTPLATDTAPSPTPVVVTVVATPTPQPSAPPPPATPTDVPPAGATIHSFSANVDVADPGDTVTLSWHWSGGEEATIHHLLPTGQFGSDYWSVGPTGSLEYTISPLRRNFDTFALHVYHGGGVAAQATLQVELRCTAEWFFNAAPDICPYEAALVGPGAEQHFQRGVMLWVAPEDRIYVLFDDGQSPRWTSYQDTWDESQPVLDPSIEPPVDLQQPVRGFGRVWREASGVRDRLGWATGEERGYQTAQQRTSHYRYPVLYIRALDGGVWQLGPNGGSWTFLPSTE